MCNENQKGGFVTNSSEGRQKPYWSLMLTSLHYRNFRLVWLGSFTEHFGEFMEIAAILWLVNELTHSPLMLTVVGSSRFMSMIFFPIVGGIMADRVNRRSLLIASLLGSFILSVLLAILAITGIIVVWHLIVIGVLGGVVGGVLGGVVGEVEAPVRAVGEIKPPRLVKRVDPTYPEIARQARVEGVVIIEATTDIYGRVQRVKVLRSIPLLDQSAIDAVRQWVYEPMVINGRPRGVIFTVTVHFKLK